jgi:hypothetical protein
VNPGQPLNTHDRKNLIVYWTKVSCRGLRQEKMRV